MGRIQEWGAVFCYLESLFSISNISGLVICCRSTWWDDNFVSWKLVWINVKETCQSWATQSVLPDTGSKTNLPEQAWCQQEIWPVVRKKSQVCLNFKMSNLLGISNSYDCRTLDAPWFIHLVLPFNKFVGPIFVECFQVIGGNVILE